MSDPHFDKVELLIPMFGANNGTTFTDYGPKALALTRVGNTKTVTSSSKFYGSSGYFDGVGDYLSAPTTVSNTVSWTVECWFRVPNLANGASQHVFFGRHPGSTINGRWYVGIRADGRLQLWCAPNPLYGDTYIANDAQWHHAAFVVDRELNEIRFYLNGVLDGTFPMQTFNLTADTLIGYYNPSSTAEALTGHLQDFRFTLGVARYAANFTPPTRLIGTITGTVLDDAGNPAVRTVAAFPRLAPQLQSALRSTVSAAADGTFTLSDVRVTEHVLVVMDDAAGVDYDDLLIRVNPT